MSASNITHFQCRHIFADGHRCGSKCLRSENFCFYHYRSHKPTIQPGQPDYSDTMSRFELPAFEDRSSIQAAITLIAQRIASGNLDSKRAGLLLYAAQIASLNLPKATNEPIESITEAELDDSGQFIAPLHELTPKPQQKSPEQLLMDEWNDGCREEEEIARKSALFLQILKNQAAQENFTLPNPLRVPHDQGEQSESLSWEHSLPTPEILPNLQAVAEQPAPDSSLLFKLSAHRKRLKLLP